MTAPWHPKPPVDDDLVRFLLARIAEDQSAAQQPETAVYTFTGTRVATLAKKRSARVLAECEAKRRIVERHTPFHVTTKNDGLNWDYRGCGECHTPEGVEEGQTWWPCATLRLLALPYADHPDYRDDWRP